MTEKRESRVGFFKIKKLRCVFMLMMAKKKEKYGRIAGRSFLRQGGSNGQLLKMTFNKGKENKFTITIGRGRR